MCELTLLTNSTSDTRAKRYSATEAISISYGLKYELSFAGFSQYDLSSSGSFHNNPSLTGHSQYNLSLAGPSLSGHSRAATQLLLLYDPA